MEYYNLSFQFNSNASFQFNVSFQFNSDISFQFNVSFQFNSNISFKFKVSTKKKNAITPRLIFYGFLVGFWYFLWLQKKKKNARITIPFFVLSFTLMLVHFSLLKIGICKYIIPCFLKNINTPITKRMYMQIYRFSLGFYSISSMVHLA